MRSGKTTKKKGSKKKGSSLPLTLINFEQGSTVDLTPFVFKGVYDEIATQLPKDLQAFRSM